MNIPTSLAAIKGKINKRFSCGKHGRKGNDESIGELKGQHQPR
jgi:hypothetical protein